MELLEQIKRNVSKVKKGLENVSCEKRLRELGLLSLKKNPGETSLWPSSVCEELISRRKIDFLHGLRVIGQGRWGGVASNLKQRDSG